MLNRTLSVRSVMLAAAAAVCFLSGCTARFAADLRNKTPQPLYAGIYQRTEVGDATLVAERLGPGDRATIGPVRARIGRTYLWVDTRPNPGLPASMLLEPGTNFIEITQTDPSNQGRLELKQVR